MPTLSLSNEDMEVNSALATHDALIELGRVNALAEIEKAAKNHKKTELLRIIENFSNDTKTVSVANKQANSWNTTVDLYYNAEKIDSYVEVIKEYLGLLHEDVEQYKETVSKLEHENKELMGELTEAHNDNSALEEKYEVREEYWTNRVAKLREKCIRKNKYIKILFWGFIFIITQMLIVEKIGISNYINTLYFSVYFPVYGCLLVCCYLCSICRNIFIYCYIISQYLYIPTLHNSVKQIDIPVVTLPLGVNITNTMCYL